MAVIQWLLIQYSVAGSTDLQALLAIAIHIPTSRRSKSSAYCKYDLYNKVPMRPYEGVAMVSNTTHWQALLNKGNTIKPLSRPW